MSTNLRNYVRAVYAFDAVARRAPTDSWDNPSPCEGWTARHVLGHNVWVVRNITAGASGGLRPAEQPEAEIAGDDPLAVWDETRAAVCAALDVQGALQREIDTPFGRSTVDGGLGIFLTDLLVHTWDVARATGVDHGIADELADRARIGLEAAGDVVRQPGLFGPATEAPAGASAADRLAAVAGRSV